MALRAGEGAPNVIPERVTLSGTIRAFSDPIFAQLRQRVTAVFTSTATMYGCNATVEWSPVRPPPGPASPRLALHCLCLAGAGSGWLGPRRDLAGTRHYVCTSWTRQW